MDLAYFGRLHFHINFTLSCKMFFTPKRLQKDHIFGKLAAFWNWNWVVTLSVSGSHYWATTELWLNDWHILNVLESEWSDIYFHVSTKIYIDVCLYIDAVICVLLSCNCLFLSAMWKADFSSGFTEWKYYSKNDNSGLLQDITHHVPLMPVFPTEFMKK